MQDAGAQLAAPLLDARDGMRVLDACAAPGGKTTHLAELAAHRSRRARQRRREDRARDPEPVATASGRARRARRRGRARALVGRRRIRSRASRCSVHRVGCGEAPPRCEMASPRKRYRGIRPTAASSSGRVVAVLGARAASCSMRPARSSTPRTACRSKHSSAVIPTPRACRCRCRRIWRRRRPTLAIGPRRRAQSRRVFLRPSPEKVSPDRATRFPWHAAEATLLPPLFPRLRLLLAMLVLLLAASARADTITVQSAELLAGRGRLRAQRAVRLLVQSDARGSAAKRHFAVFPARIRARAAALVLGR